MAAKDPKSTRRRSLLKLLGGGSVASLAGCAGSDTPESATIRMVTDQSAPSAKQVLRAAFDEWAATKEGDLSREFEFMGFDEVFPRLTTLYGAGNAPDLVLSSTAFGIAAFGIRGALADVSDIIDSLEFEFPDKYRIQKDGNDVFLPVESDSGKLQWYRSDIYDEAGVSDYPETYDENIEAVQAVDDHLSDQDMNAFFQIANPATSATNTMGAPDLIMNGVSFIENPPDAEPSVVLDEEPNKSRAIQVLEYKKKMYEYSPDTTNAGWGELISTYVTEKVATSQYPVRLLNNMVKQNPDIDPVTEPARYPKPPRVESGEEEYRSEVALNGFSIFKDAENTELAKDFAEWFMQSDHYVDLLLTVPLHKIPLDESVMDTDKFRSNEIVSNHEDLIPFIKEVRAQGYIPTNLTEEPTPYWYPMIAVSGISPTLLSSPLVGRATPEEAVDTAAEELRAELPNYRNRFIGTES